MAFITHCVALFFSYWISSIIEWALHNYCMHATSARIVPTQAFKKIHREHLEHHKNSKFDMSQRTIQPQEKFTKWLSETVNLPQYYQQFATHAVDTLDIVKLVSFDGLKHEIGIYKYGHTLKIFEEIRKLKLLKKETILEKFQGLYFEWFVSIVICLSFLFGSIVVNCIIFVPVPYSHAIIYGQIFGVYMTVCWNYIHPTQHLQPSLNNWRFGLDLIPRYQWIEDTFIYSWLWQNHVFHHLLTHSNYNVCIPGADWLFGTYKTECKGYIVDMKNKTIIKINNKQKAMQIHKNSHSESKRKIFSTYYMLPFSVIVTWQASMLLYFSSIAHSSVHVNSL